MLKICPRCRKRYVVPDYDTEYVHECKHSSEFIQKDSVPKMGKYTDPDGTTGNTGAPNLQGHVYRNWGQESWIEGIRAWARNVHGDRKTTHRLRQHYEHIR